MKVNRLLTERRLRTKTKEKDTVWKVLTVGESI